LFALFDIFAWCDWKCFIHRTDWLYSQKYDRQNASIKRSIERSTTRLVSGMEGESAA
jgi:hypothetical protein